jgi:hypothetical protein
MIYTVGHLESYRSRAAELRAEGKRLKKRGRNPSPNWPDDGYAGGIVFQTREGAEVYIKAHNHTSYAVFGLAADWETETAPHPTEPYRCLLPHVPIIFLDSTGE